MRMKNVVFRNTEILTVEIENGELYVGVRWVCNALGFTRGQINRQVKNIQEDYVLSEGASNMVLPSKGGQQESLALKLDYLPLWVSRISITPTIIEENPKLAEELKAYQLEAKDVLAKEFIEESTKQIDESEYEELLGQLEKLEDEAKTNESNAKHRGEYPLTLHQLSTRYNATKEEIADLLAHNGIIERRKRITECSHGGSWDNPIEYIKKIEFDVIDNSVAKLWTRTTHEKWNDEDCIHVKYQDVFPVFTNSLIEHLLDEAFGRNN